MRWPWGPKAAYRYPGTVIAVIDGDTNKIDIDLGPPTRGRDLGFHLYVDEHRHVHLHGSFRTLGENAAERTTPSGQRAKGFVEALLPPGAKIVVTTTKAPDDKYGGRFDAAVTLPDGRDLATVEIAAGIAAPWDGQGPRPVPGG